MVKEAYIHIKRGYIYGKRDLDSQVKEAPRIVMTFCSSLVNAFAYICSKRTHSAVREHIL